MAPGNPLSGLFDVSARVRRALDEGRPIVALETTLVTHGFPPSEGLDVAREIERIVGAEGAEPATIGILDGRIRVGLDAAELEQLAMSGRALKLNPSNLAAHLAPGCWGSTTVAATVLAAHAVGIRILSTGGIGGVHRAASDAPHSQSRDVSADLTALARHPVVVVCAGAKAVLDLPATLEALETLGVPVLGLGTDEFPAFYSRESGLPVDRGFHEIAALARAVRAHLALASGTGVLVATPIPRQHELPQAVWQPAIERALADAARRAVRGRDVTPFLLDRLRALTEGGSAFSNRELLLNNARAAARLACSLRDENPL